MIIANLDLEERELTQTEFDEIVRDVELVKLALSRRGIKYNVVGQPQTMSWVPHIILGIEGNGLLVYDNDYSWTMLLDNKQTTKKKNISDILAFIG
jgi:hypothetical protein